VARVQAMASEAGQAMVILDSDHAAQHVGRELELYAPMVGMGCYLVVEDTNINGHPALVSHGPGPWEALEAFLATTNAFVRDSGRERLLMTLNPGGYLRRVEPAG
jgi:cephalosporin hydroxylase